MSIFLGGPDGSIDVNGGIRGPLSKRQSTAAMMQPVKCNRCEGTYDLSEVVVIHRYTDCTLFTTPCCGQNVTDNLMDVSPAFTKIDKAKIV